VFLAETQYSFENPNQMRGNLFITALLVLFSVCQLTAQQQPYVHGLLSPPRGSFVKKDPGNAFNNNPTENNSTGNSGTGANLDVVYMRVDWTIDPRTPTNIITGTVLIRFKTIVANVSTITFDLNSGSFNNASTVITYHGSTIAGRTVASNILTIPLPSAIVTSGTLDSVTVAYSGVPPGVSGAAQGYQKGTGTLGASPNQYTGSLSESYEDRDWWPCKADMQDKIDSMDINVTVPWILNANADTFWVATNGVLYDSTITGSNRTFKYKTRYPIASYLVAVSVGKFNRYYSAVNISGTIVPVQFYILKNTATQPAKVTAMTKINAVVDSLSRRWGDYPFKLEKHGFYDGLNGAGGMEHQTFSAIANSALADLPTLTHELGHQWFGDNVSFATWNDLWLAEGPARFSEAYAAEQVPGLGFTATQVQTMKNTLKSGALAQNTESAWIPNSSMGNSALIWSSNYGTTVYERGGMIITMLRALCGETKFRQAMTNYQIALAGKSATTDSLKNHFNAVLKTDISGFFNSYVGGSGGTPAPGGGGIGNNVDTIYWNTPATNKLVLQVGVQTRSNAVNTNYFQGPVVVRATAAGKDTTIIFYDWGGGNLSYAGNGLSVPFTGSAINYELSFTPTALVYDDSARTMSTGGTRNITSLKGYIWQGATNSSWSTATNWMAGVVPPTGAQITIATTVNNPVLPGNITVGKLFLNAGTKLNIGANTLTINDGISGTGTITGSAGSNIILNGAAGTINMDQTSAATRSLNDLTFNLGASAKLGNAMDIYGTITLNSASLNLNAQNLTLKSNAAGTARIGDLTNSTLTGATNVTVERWIKLRLGGTGRAYRLLAPTVNTSGSIQANWMETGMNTAIGTNINPVPLFGTQITGAAGNTNGFDKTTSNSSSLYTANNAVTPTYNAVTSTSGTLNALTGYFLYIRGDRSMDMTLPLAPNMPTSSTTLRTTGTLLQGTKSTFSNAFVGGGALNLVTNPYPSPIDWSLVQAASSNITNFYTLWDPNFGTRGGFVTVNTTGVASSGLATKFIQPGQAFFVESNGGVPAVSIQESHKAAGNNNEVFLTPPPPVEAFRTELYFAEPNSYRRLVDGAIALFDNGYNAAVDEQDAKEINNWDENIAIAREGKHLAIESRPVIISKDTLPLFMNNMKQQDYEFEFTPAVFTNTNLKAELVDKFLNTRTLLSVTAPTVVPFTITADPASAASDRFTVVFGSFGGPLTIDAITIQASEKNNGVQVEWTSKTETNMAGYEVERSAFGTGFSTVNTTTALGNSATPVNYSWFDANPRMGTNFYRVKAIDKAGNIKYSDIAKVIFGKGEPGIVVYPNPIKGTTFSIDLNNLPKGSYLLNLYNNTGQLLYTEQWLHNGSLATRIIDLKTDMPKGLYQLQLSGDSGFKTTQKLIKN
jgi:Peptidase family M1 domain